MNTYYIVKGKVTDPVFWSEEAGIRVEEGDTEWQFSDAPPGLRGFSYDFLSLDEGIRQLAPAIFYFVEQGD